MTSRTEAPSHKERLLREGMRQIYASGFHGTTVDRVLEQSGVPKGSFYHHFGSKESFGSAVLSRYMQYQFELLDRWMPRTDLTTTEKLVGYFEEMVHRFVRSGFQRACLVGKMSTEVAATSEVFRTQLDEDLRLWKSRLVAVLEEGQQKGDIRTDRTSSELADGVLALIQGAFVIALSTHDEASLSSITYTIPMLIDTSPRTPADSRP
ncbi:TetR/AcrR family transcriptional regulator [Nocardia sp. AG03]|uniref:TetR/AcrR family transcriptional regulator n=1 Tax=Nocardia sp. AG03 TaxID=3025312 RepID=UPI0024185876|nr:TetR/AcrR family transcriptional regulator [Nocardia sp. AG03]